MSLLAVSTVELTIRMIVALIVIGVLLFALHRLTRRLIDGRAGNRPTIAIRHQQRLDRHASVTLLTAGDRHLLVGTTGQSIVLLAEGDDLTVDPTATEAAAAAANGPVPADGSVDLRGRSTRNPIRALQNKTVRRG